VQVVKKRGQTPEETIPDDTLLEEIIRQQWVGVAEADVTGNLQAIRQNLNLMPSAAESVRKQMRAFVLVGFPAKGELAGVNVGDFTMVQCLKTNLMLTWFCDNGAPVHWPIAAPMPMLELPSGMGKGHAHGEPGGLLRRRGDDLWGRCSFRWRSRSGTTRWR
jgi:hypothetical protein